MRKRFALGVLLAAALGGCGGSDALRINAVEALRPQTNVIAINDILDRPSRGPAPIDLQKLSLSQAAQAGWSTNALRKALPYAIGLVNTYSYQDLVDGFRRTGMNPWYRDTGSSSAKTYAWLLDKYGERLASEVGLSPAEAYRYRAQYGAPNFRAQREIEHAIARAGSNTTLGNLKWLYRIKNGQIPVGEIQVRLTAEISDVFQPPFMFSDPWAHPDWYRDMFAGAVAYTILTRAAEDAAGLPYTKLAIVPNLDGKQRVTRYFNLEAQAPREAGDMDFETYFGEWSPVMAGPGRYARARFNKLNPNRMCSIFLHADNDEALRRLGLRSGVSQALTWLPNLGDADDNLNKSIGDRLFSDESKWVYDLLLLPSDRELLRAIRSRGGVDGQCTQLLVSRVSRIDPSSVAGDNAGLHRGNLNNVSGLLGLESGQPMVSVRDLTPKQYQDAGAYAASVVDYAIALRAGELR